MQSLSRERSQAIELVRSDGEGYITLSPGYPFCSNPEIENGIPPLPEWEAFPCRSLGGQLLAVRQAASQNFLLST
ncbi:hypothetical protein [Oscillatoria sp. FACHB-1406]|uniref:hypothetical protein n=1 Tax=Oscillatoria sp. FACHB-1406 TaxID=2692846 RepID=UPI001681D560|nr:hypothetical protein [Oscillatoria sp. FACHB-1406]MBD2576200.1 hypothetical protein [Oscillatoria sp. FACHB-1406]